MSCYNNRELGTMSRYRQGRGALNINRKRGTMLGRTFFEERIAFLPMAEADQLIVRPSTRMRRVARRADIDDPIADPGGPA